MFVRYISAGLAASALLASVAFAQNPSSPSDRPSTAAATTTSDSSFQGTWRSSKLVGLSVYNDANESIGSVYELLADKSGNVKAVVIGVGGFLGVGEHLVAVAFDKVKWVTEPVAYTGTASATRPASTTSTTTGAASTTPPTTTTPTAPASSTTTTSTTPATAVKANPWYPDHAVYNATKDELKAMPEFKFNS
ncbi:MAG TPA: PRC-barrel domain-containing protein [Bradyrhizobium sp.]|jgi:sporulation protein YlmC with PRC-barrel domain|nr:PRC-barrel domain-containing protein [Bradyrhizobium sp.]